MLNSKTPNIYRIVITGGPCAGKSTAMSIIQREFTQRGYHVLFISETATELITGGVAPWTCCSNLEFQRCLLALQLHKEQVFLKAASTMHEDKVLVVCDRGVMDNKAYLDDDTFKWMVAELGIAESVLRDGYDAVFHLVTAAKGAFEFYTNANNSARTETPEQAAMLDERLVSVWSGHPYHRIIDNSTDFDGKMRRLISEIAVFLGDSEPCSTERRFLVEHPDLGWLRSNPDCCRTEVRHTYLKALGNTEVRLSKCESCGHSIYIKTVRSTMPDNKRTKTESRITEKQYRSLLNEAGASTREIDKIRYSLRYKSHIVHIDLYSFWRDKAIVIVGLKDKDEDFTLPEHLKVIKEVTGSIDYRSSTLAR